MTEYSAFLKHLGINPKQMVASMMQKIPDSEKLLIKSNGLVKRSKAMTEEEKWHEIFMADCDEGLREKQSENKSCCKCGNPNCHNAGRINVVKHHEYSHGFEFDCENHGKWMSS